MYRGSPGMVDIPGKDRYYVDDVTPSYRQSITHVCTANIDTDTGTC